MDKPGTPVPTAEAAEELRHEITWRQDMLAYLEAGLWAAERGEDGELRFTPTKKGIDAMNRGEFGPDAGVEGDAPALA